MYLNDSIQNKLREIGKITGQEVAKKQGDLYIAINVLTNESRILVGDNQLIEALNLKLEKAEKKILKG